MVLTSMSASVIIGEVARIGVEDWIDCGVGKTLSGLGCVIDGSCRGFAASRRSSKGQRRFVVLQFTQIGRVWSHWFAFS